MKVPRPGSGASGGVPAAPPGAGRRRWAWGGAGGSRGHAARGPPSGWVGPRGAARPGRGGPALRVWPGPPPAAAGLWALLEAPRPRPSQPPGWGRGGLRRGGCRLRAAAAWPCPAPRPRPQLEGAAGTAVLAASGGRSPYVCLRRCLGLDFGAFEEQCQRGIGVRACGCSFLTPTEADFL